MFPFAPGYDRHQLARAIYLWKGLHEIESRRRALREERERQLEAAAEIEIDERGPKIPSQRAIEERCRGWLRCIANKGQALRAGEDLGQVLHDTADPKPQRSAEELLAETKSRKKSEKKRQAGWRKFQEKKK